MLYTILKTYTTYNNCNYYEINVNATENYCNVISKTTKKCVNITM